MLDEPLSGLDSFTALQLMRSLQAVAASGRVVALSLHQPSPALFGALDSAMLLAAGQLVYSGPPSAAAAALAGLGCPVPPGKKGSWQGFPLALLCPSLSPPGCRYNGCRAPLLLLLSYAAGQKHHNA